MTWLVSLLPFAIPQRFQSVVIGAAIGLLAAGILLVLALFWRADFRARIEAEAEARIAARTLQAWEHASRRLAQVNRANAEIVEDLDIEIERVEGERDAAVRRYIEERGTQSESKIHGRYIH